MKRNLVSWFVIAFIILISFKLFAQFSSDYNTSASVENLTQGSTIGKIAGDVISPTTDAQIAAWCDFSKQIVVTRTGVLCVFIGTRAAPIISPPGAPAPPSPSPPKPPGVNAS